MSGLDWFKSWHGAPTDLKWLSVARKADAPVPVVIALAWALMDHASQQKNRGDISGFDIEEFAAYLGETDETLHRVTETLCNIGWLFEGRISRWEERQEQSKGESTSRVQKHRAKKRQGAQPPENPTKEKRDETENVTPLPVSSRYETLRNGQEREGDREDSIQAVEAVEPFRATTALSPPAPDVEHREKPRARASPDGGPQRERAA